MRAIPTILGTRVLVTIMPAGFRIRSLHYLDNTPSFPLQNNKTGVISSDQYRIIKMEINVSCENSYLYLPLSNLIEE